ncbi:MAG TPA: hypothetical protein DCM28_21155 [Phycisphaerales bacterium]|nr:hypothetical protein [Phycisphaerales bacterium]|tara:strand:+ start:80018 stop:82090 length:2073 start_codon:yes stop_codon:yes gene_type:complete
MPRIQCLSSEDISRCTSPQAQATRRIRMLAMIRGRLAPYLQDGVGNPHLIWWDQTRVAMWASHAFLAGDKEDVQMGNDILRYAQEQMLPDMTPNPFMTSTAASLLVERDAQLDEDTRAFLDDLLARLAPMGMTRDFQFHGYNDNMPVMFSWGMLYAGERFGHEDLLQVAHANLYQCRDLLRRRGAVSEYGMGYATHRIVGFAQIAEHCADREIQQLARDIEARIWAEIAGHWHPELGEIAGASLRGTFAVNYEPLSVFEVVFGSAIHRPWEPQESFFNNEDQIRMFGLDPKKYLFTQPLALASEFCSATFHVPDAVAELFYSKTKPFEFKATAENGYFNEGVFCKKQTITGNGGQYRGVKLTDELVVIPDHPEHGGQMHNMTTWHGKYFALGSSSTNMFPTSYAMRCNYMRTPKPASRDDIGMFTMRYNINNKVPGGKFINDCPQSPDHPNETGNYCRLYRDMGRHFCMQHQGTVVCLATPEYREYWDVKQMRLDLCFWQLHGKVNHWEIAGNNSCVDINENAVYIRIRPLIGRHLQRDQAIKIQAINEWLVVSLYNYDGPSKIMTSREMARLGNGFVLEVRDAKDYLSFKHFQQEMDQARVLDQFYSARREVHYARPDMRLSAHYCPYRHTLIHASLNGLDLPRPKLSFSNGLQDSLPFMNADPAVGFEDWDWIQTQQQREVETYNPQE